MDVEIVHLLSIIVVCLFLMVAVFQVLLLLGYPLGEFALGGYYKVLPKHLRIISGINCIILLFMGIVLLQYTNVIEGMDFLSTNLLVWVITIFLGLNTLVNLFSRSKKERMVMTPFSFIAFLLCLVIVLIH